MNTRPDWDEYFMSIAELVSTRSTCLRKSGAVLVLDRRNFWHWLITVLQWISSLHLETCLRGKRQIPSGSQQELCRGLHAEQNVIIQAALHGESTKESILYCTHKPCSLCAKMIINAGISRIVYQNPYPDPLGDELVSEAGLEVCIFKGGCES